MGKYSTTAVEHAFQYDTSRRRITAGRDPDEAVEVNFLNRINKQWMN